jgi:hypothetical protein
MKSKLVFLELVMRKFLIPLLLASALAPATAYAADGGLLRGDRPRAERGDRDKSSEDRSSDSKPQRAERAPRVERSERADRPARAERVERPDGEPRLERRIRRAERPVVEVDATQEVRATQPTQRVRRVARDGLLSGALTPNRDGDNDRDRDRWRDRDRDGSRDGSRWRDGDRDGRRWSGDWRRDHRYDWRNHRSRYSSIFRLGRYYDPYRHGYRRFSIGFTLWPSYYGSNYWLDDPWQYRLPPAYGPYRWVRYYDDALLVNIYSGQVVDVIHNFFW